MRLGTLAIKLGIVGGGVMGEAILACLLQKQAYAASEICISDPVEERCQQLADKYGVQVTTNNQVAAAGELLLLAVKPQVFETVALGLVDTPASLIISILAGVTLSQLESVFDSKAVVRAMPNTPAQVGVGMTAIAAGHFVSSEQMQVAGKIFAAVGEVLEVPESAMNAVTGLSGSGPGYIALVLEALADGGVAAGLPRAIATQLSLQTVLGTVQLLLKSGLHPAQLKDKVTSPGGTTIAGIAQLEKAGLRSALIEAVVAATRRAEELGS